MNDLGVKAKHSGTPGHELLMGPTSSSHGLTDRGEALILGCSPCVTSSPWWPHSSASNSLQPITVHRFRRGRFFIQAGHEHICKKDKIRTWWKALAQTLEG
jgi:hypothetical protein